MPNKKYSNESVKEYVFHVVLVAQSTDRGGYTTYVFKNLDDCDRYTQYFMCTRFPRWEHDMIAEGEVGYVSLRYVRAGISKWYDGDGFVTYKYSNVIFLRFVPEDEYTTESFREIREFERATEGIDEEEDDSDIKISDDYCV